MADDTALLQEILQTLNFTLAKVLIMANDIATLQTTLNTLVAQVQGIAPTITAESAAIAALGPKLDAEALALGSLAPEVSQVVTIIQQLQAQLADAAVPQSVFDSLGQVTSALTAFQTSVSSSAQALQAASGAIDASTSTIGQQVTALQAVLPPTPGPSQGSVAPTK